MIDCIKSLLWKILKEKEVSLIMILSIEGEILWHRGRPITGRSIFDGDGFSHTFIHQILKNPMPVCKDNVVINIQQKDLSQSAKNLRILSLLILPLGERFFLYIDSGSRQKFFPEEYETFKLMGQLLTELIYWMDSNVTSLKGINASCPAMRKIKQLVIKYALEDDPVLLLGETGVGKTHIAQLIHRYSGRTGKFVVADSTTINENLFESEVFGHVKGAFTGACSNKKGLIHEAQEGTLFFDEIAEVPISFQAKLLRFIETRQYRVLGEAREQKADVRIIAATNVDLINSIDEKLFREDLYYRLNILNISIPPLRERKEDIENLVRTYWKYLKGKTPGNGFWDELCAYPWPGNVRQLLTILKRVGILCNSPITGKDLISVIQQDSTPLNSIQSRDFPQETWQALIEGQSFWKAVKEPFLKRDLNRSQVKSIVATLYEKSGGKYVNMLPPLNLEPDDYKRFMKFLHKNHLQL